MPKPPRLRITVTDGVDRGTGVFIKKSGLPSNQDLTEITKTQNLSGRIIPGEQFRFFQTWQIQDKPN